MTETGVLKIKTSDNVFMINNSSLLFFLSYGIFLITMISTSSLLGIRLYLNNTNVYRIIMLFCFILLFIKELIVNAYSIDSFIQLMFILCATLLIHNVASFITAMGLFYLFSSRNEDFREIARFTIIVTFIMLVTIISLSVLGVIENYKFGSGTDRYRVFLGFKYALFAPAYYFNIIALILYLKKDKIKISFIILELIGNIWLYERTDSRLSFYFTLLLIVFSLVIKIPLKRMINIKIINSLFKPLLKAIVIMSFIICAIVSIFICINYDETNITQRKLNDVLASRLYYSQKSYNTYGVSLFGKKIIWVGNGLDQDGNTTEEEYLYVDNLYLQFLQRYGLVFFAVVMILLTYALYRIIIKKEWMLTFILVVIAMHAIIDDLVLHIWYNTFLLSLAPYIFQNRCMHRNYLVANHELNNSLL